MRGRVNKTFFARENPKTQKFWKQKKARAAARAFEFYFKTYTL
jgi:hypothetical protein